MTSIHGDIGMTPEELRLECLKLALQSANTSGLPVEASQLLSRARAFADFVLDQNGRVRVDGITPVAEMTSGRDLQSAPTPQFESRIVEVPLRGVV